MGSEQRAAAAAPARLAPPPDNAEAARALTDLVARFTGHVAKRLPDDVLARLGELRVRESSPLATTIYDAMFDNIERADRLDRPCCQETGAIQFFVRAGAGFPLLGELKAILGDAVRQATREAPLRHNAVETFVERNTGTNTGTEIPWVEWDVVPDDDTCTIDVYLAAGCASLPGAARVLTAAEGYEGVVRFVFDAVTSRGVDACPPLLVGVGVATSVETAAMLSKRALLRPIGTRHPDPRAARLEVLLENALNEVGIGPRALAGASSVMAVHVESAARHPSTIGVGLSVGCWAHRRGTLRIRADLSHEILSHRAGL